MSLGYDRLNKKNADGNTPLHIAAFKGNNDAVKMLLKLGVSVEEPNNKGETALHLAVESGSEEVVRCLLAAGANLFAETGDGLSVWHIAASVGNSKIIKILAEGTVPEKLTEEKDIIVNGNSKLSSSSDNVTSPVETEVSLNIPESPNHLSLLRSNLSSRKDEQTSEIGSEIKCPPEIDLVNRSEVKTNDKNGTKTREKPTAKSLEENMGHHLITDKHPRPEKVLESVLPARPQQNIDSLHSIQGISPQIKFNESDSSDFSDEENIREAFLIHPLLFLHELLSRSRGRVSDKEEARRHFNNLSIRNVDLNKRDHNGFTVLHMAAGVGAEDAVFRLLKKKPNVNMKSHSGATPLMMAASDGSVKIIKMLIKAGADCNVTDKNGITPLHIAAVNNNTSAVNVFLSLGLDPNSKEKEGNTPLHFAASRPGNIGPVLALLKAKADVNQPNENGFTPLFIAGITGNIEMLHMFASYRN